jgi:uncharacterized membrane protein
MRKEPTPARLEAFSDGVIAVIITIMVLGLKVPTQKGMAGFVTTLLPLLVYAQSFAATGIYWVNHHHLMDRLKRVNRLILWTNLFYLFFVSLLPFFTNYLVVMRMDSFSMALYAASLLMNGVAFTVLQWAVGRDLRRYHVYGAEEHQLQVDGERKAYISLALYLVAVPLAFVHPFAALGDIYLVTILWIAPPIWVKLPPEDKTEVSA